jgi:hypothetical protein
MLRDRLREQLGIEWDDLAGTWLSGELPLTATLVNRLIATRLAGKSAPVHAVVVEPLDQNVVDVHVTPKSRWLPAIRVQALIEQQPELPASPVLRLRWRIPGTGPLALFAGPFIANLKSLPPGVRIDGDLVFVDLSQALAAQGLSEVLQYLRALRVDTRRGVFVVKFEFGV